MHLNLQIKFIIKRHCQSSQRKHYFERTCDRFLTATDKKSNHAQHTSSLALFFNVFYVILAQKIEDSR